MYLKKMAYLLAALLVKPGDDIGLLMNNTILKDLQSDNTFVVMTTLTLLRYFLSEDLVHQILPILKKLLKHQTSIIRRKSYLVLLNVNQNFPNLFSDIKSLAIEALHDSETPVIFAGVTMLHRAIIMNPH